MEVTSFFYQGFNGNLSALVLFPLLHLLRSLSAVDELKEAHQTFAEHVKAALFVHRCFS